MKKIALVNHRYGLEIASGSEMHCRLLAERLQACYDVEVLTTCAIDDGTWANHYPEGSQLVGEIKVRRFPVAKNRDWTNYDSLKYYADPERPRVFEDEVQWIMDQGPYTPALFDFIHTNYDRYDAIIFMTYIYYTGAICILGVPNAIFLPTAHDELAIRLPFYRESFASPPAYIFNTQEEKAFLEQMFPVIKNKDSVVGAFGLDLPDVDAIPTSAPIDEPYILYAGRITPAKGCSQLIQFFQKYKQEYKNDLKLVLIGKKDMELPESDDIRFLGFVDEDEKRCLMRHAKLFVLASHFESLSIVVLEAMAVGTPVLVTSKCDVLKGHVERGQAGYCFDDYPEFALALDDALENTESYQKKKQNGPGYVKNSYSWEKVVQSISSLVDRMDFKRSDKTIEESDLLAVEYYRRSLLPTFSSGIPIIMASDNNYAEVLAVALQSVIESSMPEHNYDVVVLSDGINAVNKSMLLQMVESRSNISLRFLEVADYLNEYDFSFTNERLSRATFMRLLIPKLFQAYEKVLYLDCDIVVRRDVAELFESDLGENMFGAIRDTHIASVWKFRPNIEQHLRENVKLKNPCNYFNAGVLVINLRKLMEEYDSEKLLSIATSRKWMWEDQDVLNLVAAERVRFMDVRWNFFWVVCPRVMQVMKSSLEYCQAMRAPFLIHYAAGLMPISKSGEPFADVYWSVAKRTPFYELLLKKANRVVIAQNQVQSPNFAKQNVIVKKSVGFVKSICNYGIGVTLQTIAIYFRAYWKYSGEQRHAYIFNNVNALRIDYESKHK